MDQAALTTLARFHHFPTIVLEYRRLSAICDATIKRLELPLRLCPLVGQHRLVPTVDFRSSTGRLKFMAPCLQNIPKEIPVAVRLCTPWLMVAVSTAHHPTHTRTICSLSCDLSFTPQPCTRSPMVPGTRVGPRGHHCLNPAAVLRHVLSCSPLPGSRFTRS